MSKKTDFSKVFDQIMPASAGEPEHEVSQEQLDTWGEQAEFEQDAARAERGESVIHLRLRERKTKRIPLSFTPSMYAEIKAAAAGLNISINELVTALLREYLDSEAAKR